MLQQFVTFLNGRRALLTSLVVAGLAAAAGALHLVVGSIQLYGIAAPIVAGVLLELQGVVKHPTSVNVTVPPLEEAAEQVAEKVVDLVGPVLTRTSVANIMPATPIVVQSAPRVADDSIE